MCYRDLINITNIQYSTDETIYMYLVHVLSGREK